MPVGIRRKTDCASSARMRAQAPIAASACLAASCSASFFVRPVPCPELLAVDLSRAGEVTCVRRPVDVDDDVVDAAARLRERLLELGLVVDVRRPRVLDPVGERRHDRRRDRAVAVLEEERRDRGFEQRGGDVPALDDPGELVAGEALARRLRRAAPRASARGRPPRSSDARRRASGSSPAGPRRRPDSGRTAPSRSRARARCRPGTRAARRRTRDPAPRTYA